MTQKGKFLSRVMEKKRGDFHLGEAYFTHTTKQGRAESRDRGTRAQSTREESLPQVTVNPTFSGSGSIQDRGPPEISGATERMI
jgi:hypothetical protein